MRNFLIFLIFLFSFAPVFADVMPQSQDSINMHGIGILRIANEISIYRERSKKSEIAQTIYWDNLQNFKTKVKVSEKNTFAAYVPDKNYAFLSVIDEDDDWVCVCYDQKNQKTGWIKKDENSKFFEWKDFIGQYGRKKGIYIFNKNRELNRLYARPDDTSRIIDRWDFAKHIEPYYVNGNWLMVKIINYDDTQKTGYIRWRTDDGKLLIFVKLK